MLRPQFDESEYTNFPKLRDRTGGDGCAPFPDTFISAAVGLKIRARPSSRGKRTPILMISMNWRKQSTAFG